MQPKHEFKDLFVILEGRWAASAPRSKRPHCSQIAMLWYVTTLVELWSYLGRKLLEPQGRCDVIGVRTERL